MFMTIAGVGIIIGAGITLGFGMPAGDGTIGALPGAGAATMEITGDGIVLGTMAGVGAQTLGMVSGGTPDGAVTTDQTIGIGTIETEPIWTSDSLFFIFMFIIHVHLPRRLMSVVNA